jgi:Flp pilus assembly protein TadD
MNEPEITLERKANLLFEQAVLFNVSQKHEGAIASCDKALEIKPDGHEAYHNRGSSLANLGRYEEAIDSYDKALEIKPDDYEAYNNCGSSLANLGRYEEAIDSYDKALEINPNDPKVFYGKACCYGLQNQVELAIEVLKRAIALDSKYQGMAKTDTDFDLIRESDRFRVVVEGD